MIKRGKKQNFFIVEKKTLYESDDGIVKRTLQVIHTHKRARTLSLLRIRIYTILYRAVERREG